MEGVQIVGSLDVATLLFTLFNLFFVGLVFYLAREGRREGYPLEADETGKLESIGSSWMPKPKTYKLPDGREKTVPNDVRDPSIDDRATRMAPWAGAPIEPVGDPMKAALGSGAYTMREDVPDMTHENLPKIVPMSAMPDFSVASEGPNPHGFSVVAGDGEVAGTISDIWIDRAEALVRYYEVELADGGRKVLLPFGFADVKGKKNQVLVPVILASQFADVPAHASSQQVTRLEEDKISAYYGGGVMYATPDRAEIAYLGTEIDMCDPDEIKDEPIPGLPDDLPEGEDILWRGGPDWKALAMHVFHVRAVAIYFAVLMAWQVSSAVMAGTRVNVALADFLMLIPMAMFAIGLLSLLAWLIARTTIYTITNERVVIRTGVALPKAINIPFLRVGSAGLMTRKSGNGDIPLQMTGPDRALYMPLWPHARPWKLINAQPMLRGLPDATTAAEILAKALAAKAGQNAPAINVTQPEPVRGDRLGEQVVAANG